MLTRLFLLLSIVTLACPVSCEVIVTESGTKVGLCSGLIVFEFDLATGLYSIASLEKPDADLERAAYGINGISSDQNGLRRTWKVLPDEEAFGANTGLEVITWTSDELGLVLQVTVHEDCSAVELKCGLCSLTSLDQHVHSLRPVISGEAFSGVRDFHTHRFLGGEAGDGVTRVTAGKGIESPNNALLTFEGNTERFSLVGGGLCYDEWVKYCCIGQPGGDEDLRQRSLTDQFAGVGELVSWRNCGAVGLLAATPGSQIEIVPDNQFTFPGAWRLADHWFSEVAYAPSELTVKLTGLSNNESYALGWSWWDPEQWGITASVALTNGAATHTILHHYTVPAWSQDRRLPEEWMVPIPPELVGQGTVRVVFSKESEAPHVLLSEVWLVRLTDNSVVAEAHSQTSICDLVASQTGGLTAPVEVNLWAEDPVGKLVRAGETYLPVDSFYLDLVTPDPFDALEAYGKAVAHSNNAAPNTYGFPTICAWYASYHAYGGGPDINRTDELVKEADRVADSGFLRYSPVALRLVPDDYGLDNEQGWWDDEHWRRYGHYRAPYDTSELWASALSARGVIPLTYVQTGLMSRDYAETFPEHLLFDGAGRLDQPFARKTSPVDFDYTDPGFAEHLERVYSNLRAAGLAGLMFDYPNRAWHSEGGFEDPLATTAGAYRSVYAQARKGLGNQAWLHERILRTRHQTIPMTDLSVGLVDSQRVWGDTDGVSLEMYTRCGLRWYKQGHLYYYDLDAKNLFRVAPSNRDGLRQLLTMATLTAGRLLLANSLAQLTPDQLADLSRVYPIPDEAPSFRPLDAFSRSDLRQHPQVYAAQLGPGWYQVILLNTDLEQTRDLELSLGTAPALGGLGCDHSDQFLVYDFWNNRSGGIVPGDGLLRETVRPGEARVLALRWFLGRPQIIGTSRHVLTGFVALRDVDWDPGTQELSGSADVVGGEPLALVLHAGGQGPVSCGATGEAFNWLERDPDFEGIWRLWLSSDSNQTVKWHVCFDPVHASGSTIDSSSTP